MNTASYYNAARAFVAFDAFMVVAFTITLLGLARTLSLHFVRTLAIVWLVYVVRVAERSLYFALDNRTSLTASALVGVFAVTCVLPVILVRHALRSDDASPPAVPAGLLGWGVFAFALGVLVHAATAQLDVRAYEVASAVWSRAFAGVPLLVLLALTAAQRGRQPAVEPLFWGFVVQLGALFIDTVIRVRGFGPGMSPLEERLVSAMTLVSTLATGIASIMAAVEKEREYMAEQARRLQLAQERALESERWQHVGQLARGVAHDLNNVLSALLAGGDLVSEGVRLKAPETEADFAELEQAVGNGRSLTGRLMRFTRQEPVEPQLVTIGDIGRAQLPVLRRMVGPEREFNLVSQDAQPVMADPVALEQVLLNLVLNARDATAPGGRIDVQIGEERIDAVHPMALGALERGPYVCLSVADNGSGMSPEVLARLWEPFFTTKGDRGSGIGLPTVASLVVEMRGAIDVQSVDGAGSRFRVWFPVARQGT